MSATALSLAAVLALATNPRCGAATPGSEFAPRLAAIATYESGRDPLIVNVNGPGGGPRRFDTAAGATAFAHALDAAGRDYDAGLMQVNRRQFARDGLTVETAFDACRSMAAGAAHYAADLRAVWTLAHRHYNCGGTDCGIKYAAGVEQVLTRIEAEQPAASVPPSSPAAAPAGPPPPPVWDLWAYAEWQNRPRDAELTAPATPAVSAAETVTPPSQVLPPVPTVDAAAAAPAARNRIQPGENEAAPVVVLQGLFATRIDR